MGQGEDWAENKEIATGFYMQVDVWSKGDFTNIAGQVKSLLEDVGLKELTRLKCTKVILKSIIRS